MAEMLGWGERSECLFHVEFACGLSAITWKLPLPCFCSCKVHPCLHFTTPQAFADQYKLMKTIGNGCTTAPSFSLLVSFPAQLAGNHLGA